MLNLTDIVALAKQGYKPSDIKELIELTKTEGPEGGADDQEQQPKPDEHEKPSEEGEKKDNKPSDDQPVDYKEEVEKLKNQLQETENKLKLLQKENTKQNADTGDKKSDAEMFAEVAKSFM